MKGHEVRILQALQAAHKPLSFDELVVWAHIGRSLATLRLRVLVAAGRVVVAGGAGRRGSARHYALPPGDSVSASETESETETT